MKRKKLNPEIKDLLKQAEKVSKALKITRQEAILLIVTHQLVCIHDHVNKVVFGIIASHSEKVEVKK